MKLDFQAITPDIAPAFGAFLCSLWENGDEDFFHPHELNHAEADRIARLRGRDRYYVLMTGGAIKGYGMLRGWDDGYEIPSLGLAIHPSFRGQGLGKLFMEFLHSEARRAGASQVRLTVDGRNPAQHLYRAMGYQFHSVEATGTLIGYLQLAKGASENDD